MLIDTIWIIIIEILQKRTFEDVLFFCVMKMRFMVGVENQEIEKNPLVIISKRDENWEKSKKTQPEKSKWCEKLENRGKYPIEGMQAGQKNGKTRKKPSRRKASGVKKRKIEKYTQSEKSEPGKKAENREKYPAREK